MKCFLPLGLNSTVDYPQRSNEETIAFRSYRKKKRLKSLFYHVPKLNPNIEKYQSTQLTSKVGQ